MTIFTILSVTKVNSQKLLNSILLTNIPIFYLCKNEDLKVFRNDYKLIENSGRNCIGLNLPLVST